MSKHEKKAPKKGAGADLIGLPDELIKLLIKKPEDRQWTIDEIANEGPPHKQVLSALMLKRLYKLVKTVEKTSGNSFELQKGNHINAETEEAEIVLPATLPVNLGSSVDKDKVVEMVSHAPIHEILAYTMCLQVIEWCIKSIDTKK